MNKIVRLIGQFLFKISPIPVWVLIASFCHFVLDLSWSSAFGGALISVLFNAALIHEEEKEGGF